MVFSLPFTKFRVCFPALLSLFINQSWCPLIIFLCSENPLLIPILAYFRSLGTGGSFSNTLPPSFPPSSLCPYSSPSLFAPLPVSSLSPSLPPSILNWKNFSTAYKLWFEEFIERVCVWERGMRFWVVWLCLFIVTWMAFFISSELQIFWTPCWLLGSDSMPDRGNMM